MIDNSIMFDKAGNNRAHIYNEFDWNIYKWMNENVLEKTNKSFDDAKEN